MSKAKIEPLVVRLWPDAGQALDLCKSSTYAAAQRGYIPVIRLGRRIVVSKKALDRLVNGEAAA